MNPALPNLRHLTVFCAVARHGSLSAAARLMHLTQPAVTQAIVALEREFGGALFVRNSLGVTSTAAGRVCAARITRALDRIRGGLAVAGRQGRGVQDMLHGITAAQLGAVAATVEHGGFGSAARALGMTRATLHRAARQLEKAVGGVLFERTSHGVRATREADRLARQIALAVEELAQARAEVAALGGAERGRTVIGAMPLARSVIVPAAVLGFLQRRPLHAISILDGPYESMLDAMRRGRADILVGALRDDPPEDVRQEHLFDDPLAIIVRAGHPLAVGRCADRRAPTYSELLHYPWVAPRPGSPLRRQFEALFSAGDPSPAGTPIECNSLVAARSILLGSDRMMLLSAHQVHHDLATGQLALLAHPAGRITRSIGITVRRDWIPTETQKELIETLHERVRVLGLTDDAAPPRPKPRVRGKRAASSPPAARRTG